MSIDWNKRVPKHVPTGENPAPGKVEADMCVNSMVTHLEGSVLRVTAEPQFLGRVMVYRDFIAGGRDLYFNYVADMEPLVVASTKRGELFVKHTSGSWDCVVSTELEGGRTYDLAVRGETGA